jgi:uncharacterized protein YjiS (DUF1127 family)
MVDRLFAEPSLAVLYDLFCPWDPRGDLGFYLPLVMRAASVLDVGCGTGMLLRRARAEGHGGRLCGLDPAAAMLDVARETGEEVEWVLGDLSSVGWSGEFDLVVMTGRTPSRSLTVRGDLVSFTTTYSSPAWRQPERSRSQLRFLSAEALADFLAGAGLEIEEQYGDWDRSELRPGSPEIITVAAGAALD